MIFATAFNISTDLMLLCIPIPIVIQSKIPMKRCVPTYNDGYSGA
jgi:hypothetical protein